jgi:hypothetical protein
MKSGEHMQELFASIHFRNHYLSVHFQIVEVEDIKNTIFFLPVILHMPKS